MGAVSDRFDPQTIRKEFPIFEREVHGKALVYLDSAATSQKPRQVIDALTEFWEQHNANVHRGVYLLAEEATAMYEGARDKAAALLRAPDPGSVVFTRGTTEAINLVAHGWGRKFLTEGDEIVLTELEHHSNIVPWQLAARDTGAKLRFVPYREDGLLDPDDFAALITDRTKLVAVTGMSNVLGTISPIGKIVSHARTTPASWCWWTVRSWCPHMPVDVGAVDVDFLTFSGHKMLGPDRLRRPVRQAGAPRGHGPVPRWRRDDHGGAARSPPPTRSRRGSSRPALPRSREAVALGVAIDYLRDLGMDAVREHERELTEYAMERLTGCRGAGIRADRSRSCAVAPSRSGSATSTLTTWRRCWTARACASAPATTARSR